MTTPVNEVVTSFETTGRRLTAFENSVPTAAAAVVQADLTNPKGVAVARGFGIWVVNSVPGAGSLFGGSVTSVTDNLSSTDFNDPQFLAFDGANNAWVSNLSNGAITSWDRAFATPAVFTNFTGGGTISAAEGIAVDLSGNVWVANSGNNTVSELVGLGTPVVTPLQAALIAPYSAPAIQP